MKKIISVLIAVCIAFSLMVFPACAWDGGFSWPWWRNWQPTTQEPDKETTEEPVEEPTSDTIPAPAIAKATYCHHNQAYSGFDNHLQILWDEVEGADSYEVEITKADGTVDTYTTTAACLYIATDCPKVYVESSGSFQAATARVRAVAGGTTGDWSDGKKISCNAMHHH